MHQTRLSRQVVRLRALLIFIVDGASALYNIHTFSHILSLDSSLFIRGGVQQFRLEGFVAESMSDCARET